MTEGNPMINSVSSTITHVNIPVFLREALDELQKSGIGEQVKWTLALVVGIIDVSALLC